MDRRRANLLSVGVLALAAVLSACGENGGRPEGAAKPNGAAADAGYQAPLRTMSVSASPEGGAIVRGTAPPEARVRAEMPGGAAYGATTDGDGAFVIELPRSSEARLVALSAEEADRSVQAEGWLFVPPDRPDASVLLRAGAPALPMPGAGVLATVDYDAGGAAAVAGRTTPNAPIRVFVDGVAAGRGRSDAAGVYGVRLNGPYKAGEHALRVETDKVAVERRVGLASHAPNGVFTAARTEGGWRVDWTPPGGGAQSTLVLIEPKA